LTLEDLKGESCSVRDEIREKREELRTATQRVSSVEERLQPRSESLNEILAVKSRVERQLATFDQIRTVAALRGELSTSDSYRPEAPRSLNVWSSAEYARMVKDLLGRWGVPDSTRVDLENRTLDLIVDSRPRGSRGKGMRAMLHAAATLALKQYCEDRELPFPGFAVLDSPLVTYRQPDLLPGDEPVGDLVKQEFFRYLEDGLCGQVVILENEDPPVLTSDDSVAYHFTRQPGLGRYGYFPNIL
jgi:hypothetical protein